MEDQSTPMTTQDLYNASVIFSQAISLMLEENQGIIVDIVPEMSVVLQDEPSKVFVFKLNKSIHIQKYDGDMEAGTPVTINVEDENTEE